MPVNWKLVEAAAITFSVALVVAIFVHYYIAYHSEPDVPTTKPAPPAGIKCYSCSNGATHSSEFNEYLLNYNVPGITPGCSKNVQAVDHMCRSRCFSLTMQTLTIRGCTDHVITAKGWSTIHKNLSTATNGCHLVYQETKSKFWNLFGGETRLSYMCFCNTNLCNHVTEYDANWYIEKEIDRTTSKADEPDPEPKPKQKRAAKSTVFQTALVLALAFAVAFD